MDVLWRVLCRPLTFWNSMGLEKLVATIGSINYIVRYYVYDCFQADLILINIWYDAIKSGTTALNPFRHVRKTCIKHTQRNENNLDEIKQTLDCWRILYTLGRKLAERGLKREWTDCVINFKHFLSSSKALMACFICERVFIWIFRLTFLAD